ncbi:MAG: alpha/beta hydrolase [Eubacteriaceae bacterium]|nr:alpha/beta hydrolase [Eubacteriaceae bacterium]
MHSNISPKAKRKYKVVGIALAVLLLAPLAALFMIRGVSSIMHRLPNRIQEKAYISLGGIEQYINVRGKSAQNPVVIWLHGGPGNPDTFLTTSFQRKMEDSYTFVRWDQRGCGRTYYKNKQAPLSWLQMLDDLDSLVDYASDRFMQPIIIVGHSWGSALGSAYAAEHPDKIAGFVGIGQFIDGRLSDQLAAEAAAEMARSSGKERDARDIEAYYSIYEKAGFSSDDFDIKAFGKFRQLASKYLSPNDKNPSLAALMSPDFGWNDLRWNLKLMSNMNWYIGFFKPLNAALESFSPPDGFEVPVCFISGKNDFICATKLVREYNIGLNTPSSEMFTIVNTGHYPMFDNSTAFKDCLDTALSKILAKQ